MPRPLIRALPLAALVLGPVGFALDAAPSAEPPSESAPAPVPAPAAVPASNRSPAPEDPAIILSELNTIGHYLPRPADDIPQASAFFDPAALARLNIDSLTEVAAYVPGFFTLEQGPGVASLNFRGILSESTDPRQSPRVGLTFDDTPIARPGSASLAWFDLEHVEVLKGPQDAALGRGATAGAVLIQSAKPTATAGGELTATVGDFDRGALTGHVNVPLSAEGRLGARLAFQRDVREGYVSNLAGGAPLQSRDTLALRPSLLWQPSEATSITVSVHHQQDQPTGTAFKSLVIPDRQGGLDPYGPADLNRGDELGFDREVTVAALRLEHAFADRWTLTSHTGGVDFDVREDFDGDGSRLPLLELTENQHGHQFSQDLRLTRSLDELGHIHLGARYLRDRHSRNIRLSTDEGHVWPFFSSRFRSSLLAAGVPAGLVNTAVPVLPPFVRQASLPAGFAAFSLVPSLAGLAPLAGAPLSADYEESYEETASSESGELYAGGTFRPVPRLELSAAVRVIHEDQTLGYQVPFADQPSKLGFLLGGTPNLANRPTPGGARRTATLSDADWSARLGASYELTPRWQAFGSLARGRRPGTIVVTSTAENELSPETVLAGELGLRWSSADARATAQAAVYRQTFSHFQTVQADPANPARFIPRDAGALTGEGAEFSARILLAERWEVFASYGYTEATFDDYGDDGQPQSYAGNTTRLTSRHTFATGLTYRHPLARHGALFVSPVAQYRSAHYFEDENDLFGGRLRQGGFTVVNLRAGWVSPARRWRVAAFADNLLDKAWLLDAGNLGANYGIPTVIRAAPRLVGIETTLAW